VTNFKIGDKVRVIKLSEKDFKKTYVKNGIYGMMKYSNYINRYSEYFGKVSIVNEVDDNDFDLCKFVWIEKGLIFFKEELEKVNSLKIRLQLIKELIK
jgi:hypothetical protein